MAVALVLAILALGWMQNRRYARPALQLAHFVDHLESDMGAKAPKVPVIWSHWFERVAGAAAERRQLLAKTLEHARELEQKVQERTTT
jgi:hypothetical protein